MWEHFLEIIIKVILKQNSKTNQLSLNYAICHKVIIFTYGKTALEEQLPGS